LCSFLGLADRNPRICKARRGPYVAGKQGGFNPGPSGEKRRWGEISKGIRGALYGDQRQERIECGLSVHGHRQGAETPVHEAAQRAPVQTARLRPEGGERRWLLPLIDSLSGGTVQTSPLEGDLPQAPCLLHLCLPLSFSSFLLHKRYKSLPCVLLSLSRRNFGRISGGSFFSFPGAGRWVFVFPKESRVRSSNGQSECGQGLWGWGREREGEVCAVSVSVSCMSAPQRERGHRGAPLSPCQGKSSCHGLTSYSDCLCGTSAPLPSLLPQRVPKHGDFHCSLFF
ncbi:hypothetical protein E2320_011953, partial [Naja naja]